MTLESLESRQKVKLVTTAVTTPTGNSRLVRIACLPTVSEDNFNAFLAKVGSTYLPIPPEVKTLDQPLDYGGRSKSVPRSSHVTSVDFAKSSADIEKIFSSSDDVIRDAILNDKTTLAQLYGYKIGKFARARELHLSTIALIEAGCSSSNIVSSTQRIVNIAFYSEDFETATFCTLVACLSYDENLLRLLQSEDGRRTPLSRVSSEIREVLQLSRSRTRSRLMELLDVLRFLELAVPLRPSNSTQPSFTCEANGEHPSAYEIASDEHWSSSAVPIYWRFNTSAPLYLWALRDHDIPLWASLPTSSVEECIEYWRQLQRTCTDFTCAQELEPQDSSTTVAPSGPSLSTLKILRRSSSWKDSYHMSWIQLEYLKRFVDTKDAKTPLQDKDGGHDRLQKICQVSCAPLGVVKSFFESSQHDQLREFEKLQKREKRRIHKASLDQVTDATGVDLAHRAAEAKRQKEEVWEDMVKQIHPTPLQGPALTRLQHVRSKFLEGSGKASKKWEVQISKALEEARIASETLLPARRPPLNAPMLVAGHVLPPPVATNAPEKPIEELIALQGPRAARPQSARSKKKSAAGACCSLSFGNNNLIIMQMNLRRRK